MPAPSPISLSAPTAPRWSRFSRILQTLLDDLVRALALDVGDEADAAGVVLVPGSVQAVAGGDPSRCLVRSENVIDRHAAPPVWHEI